MVLGHIGTKPGNPAGWIDREPECGRLEHAGHRHGVRSSCSVIAVAKVARIDQVRSGPITDARTVDQVADARNWLLVTAGPSTIPKFDAFSSSRSVDWIG